MEVESCRVTRRSADHCVLYWQSSEVVCCPRRKREDFDNRAEGWTTFSGPRGVYVRAVFVRGIMSIRADYRVPL